MSKDRIEDHEPAARGKVQLDITEQLDAIIATNRIHFVPHILLLDAVEEIRKLRRVNDQLEKQGSELSAGQCIQEGYPQLGEGGHVYCPLGGYHAYED